MAKKKEAPVGGMDGLYPSEINTVKKAPKKVAPKKPAAKKSSYSVKADYEATRKRLFGL